ncbi:24058_t:CDS:1, partial [Gigaspora rosea]
STVKFTPHHYYNEPLLKLLKNPNLRQIWASTNNNSNEEFWIRLAQFGLSRAFNGDSTFTELVALMVQIKEKKFQGKSLKGLRYSEHLIHFFSLLSESSREYEIFRKAFAGFSIQRI